MEDIVPLEIIAQHVVDDTINKLVEQLENHQNLYMDIEREVIRECEIFHENIGFGEK